MSQLVSLRIEDASLHTCSIARQQHAMMLEHKLLIEGSSYPNHVSH